MAKEQIQVKICDRCRGRTEAVVTRNYEWFGTKYRIDLCEKHDEAFRAGKGELSTWIEASECLTQRIAPQERVAPPPGLYDKVIRLPGPEDDWHISKHAHERMVERQISEDVARRVAQFPSSTAPSQKVPTMQERYGEGLIVVVDPKTKTIVTVAGEQKIAVG